MRKVNNVPWEIIGGLGIIILSIAIPAFVGISCFKIFRLIKPFEPAENESAQLIQQEKTDSFLKMYVVGWLLCGPVFYVLYRVYLSAST